jgi:hypothetical protein
MVAKPKSITAILLSWKRTHNLPRILQQLEASPLISEIMLWNNDPGVQLEFPGVKVINSPRNYHCLARYCLVPLAANQTIWFQDDDVVIRPDQIEAIHSEYIKDPSRLYGAAGRNIVNGLYSADLEHGECDIILGQTMLFNRALLYHAFEPAGLPPVEVLEDDIIFSLACGCRHFAVDVGPIEMPGWDDEAAIWKRPGHFEQRQQAVDFMLAWRSKD